MNRIDIISRIGDKYHVGNTEAGEFSYVKALKRIYVMLFVVKIRPCRH